MMSLGMDIRNLTIPFMLLVSKLGIDEWTMEKKNTKKGKRQKGGCGCRFIGGGTDPLAQIHHIGGNVTDLLKQVNEGVAPM